MSKHSSSPVISIEDVRKSFTLHLQEGLVIPVFEAASLVVGPGECVVLTGASGIGKSTMLKL
ncbi:MAG: phosphonate C-P lyase system protein PhnL, partial [Pseudomonadota bacterium]